MRIEAVDVIVSSPGRNYVTVKIVTDTGVVGWGDATLNGRELAVAALLTDHLAPLLIGRDATRISETWQYLYRGAYWRRGGIGATAIGAIDIALWDIAAKALGVPLYRLLGGRARDGATVYGHASGADLDAVFGDVESYLQRGYRAVRVQALVPGLTHNYGVHTAGAAYEPAAGARPEVEVWDTTAYLDFVPDLMRQVRDRFGYGFALLHDAHHRLSANEAAQLGRSLEPYRMFWLEDVTPAEDQAAFRLIRSRTTTPLAVGEVFSDIWMCQQLITERLIDYIRVAVPHAGGITHTRRIWDLADLYGVRTGSHGPSDVSPIGLAAALHLGLVAPNFGIQEFMGYPAVTSEVFGTSWTLREGLLDPDDTPGLGVTFDEAAAARHPYDQKYLPVATLRDGSVHDW